MSSMRLKLVSPKRPAHAPSWSVWLASIWSNSVTHFRGDRQALERVPSDIRKEGGVARMSDPQMIKEIIDAVTIPVRRHLASTATSTFSIR